MAKKKRKAIDAPEIIKFTAIPLVIT